MLRLIVLVAAVLGACSQIVPDRSKRAIGGDLTWLGDRSPFLVQIDTQLYNEEAKENRFQKTHQCLGALITPKMVLTPAHCFDNSPKGGEIFVRGGSDYTKEQLFGGEVKWKFYESRKVVKVNVHPDYKKGSPAYDLALLTLQKPFDMEINPEKIFPIAIATPEQAADPTRKPETAGYGAKFNQIQGDMRRIYLNRLSAHECGGHAAESQMCFETEKGELEHHDIGTPAWLASRESEPALLLGINTAIHNHGGRHVAVFTDLNDPKVRAFIDHIRAEDEKPKGVMSKLFG